jgi:hypothetical protein
MARGPRVFICSDDEPPSPPRTDCPNNAAHEPWPKGYLAASAYADRMLETHDCSQCPACGRWAIWTLKKG